MDQQELKHLRQADWTAEFLGAEVLTAVFRTDLAVLARILPRPLRAPKDPLGFAFVAHYPQTNFGTVYSEAALFVQAEHKGKKGMYCLAMPVDDDMAMAGGREAFGYPKKMAESITLQKAGHRVVGSVVRKGTELIRIEVAPDRPVDIDALALTGQRDTTHPRAFEVTVYLFKHFQSPTMRGFDYLPRLIAEPVLLRPSEDVRAGKGALTLTSSPFDPVGEIPVVEMITCAYGTYDNTMLPGKVVGRVWNPLAFAKHALFKVDVVPHKLGYVDDYRAGAQDPQPRPTPVADQDEQIVSG